MNINLPHVVAEVSAAFAAYEKALADHNTFLINALVWEDPRTIRYGFDNMQKASEKVQQFHVNTHRVGAGVVATTTTITTFGHDYATVNREVVIDNSALQGCTTLVWARVGPDSQPEAGLHSGWRIVALHGSVISRRSGS